MKIKKDGPTQLMEAHLPTAAQNTEDLVKETLLINEYPRLLLQVQCFLTLSRHD